ncbi:MAG: Fic family protein [Candidatus Zixiibacteriota bacterium]|nr:MAG: Fic family protein [candidate division Zixibacteria bacterium]
MDKALKSRIKQRYFEVHEKLKSLPAAREEIMHVLGIAAAVNSSAMAHPRIDRTFLQQAIDRSADRRWEKISSEYSRAMVETRALYRTMEAFEETALTARTLTLTFLLQQHRNVFERTRYNLAGRLRAENGHETTPAGLPPPHPSKLPELIEHHLAWLNHRLKIFGAAKPDSFFEIFHIAAEAQYRLVGCMPFDVGNQRLGRMVSDYVLLYSGLFWNLIRADRRREYSDALKTSSVESLTPLVGFLIGSFGDTLDRIGGFLRLAQTRNEREFFRNFS